MRPALLKIKKSVKKRLGTSQEASLSLPPAAEPRPTSLSPPNIVGSRHASPTPSPALTLVPDLDPDLAPAPALTPPPPPPPALAPALAPVPALFSTATLVTAPTPAPAPTYPPLPSPSTSFNKARNASASSLLSPHEINSETAQGSGKGTPNLWGQALEKLRKKGLSGLDFKGDGNIQLFRDLLAEAKTKKEECEAKRFSYMNSRGEKVLYADAIVNQLNKYALIGDIAIQHHPDVVALAWGGFRFLLQVGTAYTENMAIMSESLEYLVSVIFCCGIYEKLYSSMLAAKSLNNSMVDLYVSILEYLICAKKLLQKNTMVRVLESFSSKQKRHLESIHKLERVTREKADTVEKEAASNERSDQAARGDGLRNRLAEIQGSIQSMGYMVINSYDKIRDMWEYVEDRKRLEVLRWVSEVEYGSHHEEFKSRRHQHTGNWLLEDEKYGDWEQLGPKRIFWLRGDAGSGKTMLVSKVIDTFKDRPKMDNALAYFYCYFQEPARSDPKSVLRAIVKQLCIAYSEEHIPKPLLLIYEKRKKEAYSAGPLRLDESKDLIIELLKEFEQTAIIIDALDECDPKTRQPLWKILKEIATLGNRVKIFLSSRNEGDIRRMLCEVPNHYIEAKDNSGDIKKYIQKEIGELFEEKPSLKADPTLKNEVISTLESGANGMFLWAHLQIETIREEDTIGDVRRALKELPEDLDKTYLNILERIQNQNKTAHRRAKMVLKWIICAQGVCSHDTVSQALLVEPMKSHLDKDQLMDRPQILSICRNLVIYDKKLKVFRFAHFSVKEFLRGQEEFSLAKAHTILAEICLTILINYPDHTTCPVPQLLDYAIFNWAAHVRLSESGSVSPEWLWKNFLNPSMDSYQAWALRVTMDDYSLEGSEAGVICPLWVACYYQLFDVFMFLLNRGLMPNCYNRYGMTPLFHATEYGYKNFVEVLVQKDGVDVNCKNEDGVTPLLLAIESGNEKLVEMLLRKDGVDVNCKDKYGRTPLSWAIEDGNEKLVEMLLGKDGVDVNCKDEDGRTPLILAIEKEGGCDKKIVEMLLGKDGVDVNCKGGDGITPLSTAVYWGYKEVVEMLLRKDGVDVNCKDKYGRIPLSLATESGNEKLVEMLLRKDGVDVNCKGKDGQTPLLLAVIGGHKEVVEMLLGKDEVDINCKGKDRLTPLSLAVSGSHKEIEKLLLRKGTMLKAISQVEG